MIHHVSIGVRDIDRARRFYDAVLAPLGHRCLSDSPGALGYGAQSPMFWLNSTDRPVRPDPASGLHLCFGAPDREAVEAFHAAGIHAGGQDNGKPGVRIDYDPGYYAAFLIDPDGYRIEAYYPLDQTH